VLLLQTKQKNTTDREKENDAAVRHVLFEFLKVVVIDNGG
jgi:hypothetical protein